MLFPDYIFETSWEVCNKVGGIYTVLSTRAKTLQDKMKDHVIFLGPDCWQDTPSPYFKEDKTLFADWQQKAASEGLSVKVGRWDIPGEPIAMLVGFQSFFEKKSELFGKLWEYYHVDSLHAYGDYDESAMFAYATALVVESFYKFYLSKKTRSSSMRTNGRRALLRLFSSTVSLKSPPSSRLMQPVSAAV